MNEPLKLVTQAEAARRLCVSQNTLKRRIKKAGVIPDAILEEGSNRVISPLFVEPRLSQFAALMNVEPPINA